MDFDKKYFNDLIASDDIEGVIDGLRKYANDTNDDKLDEELIKQSSRLVSYKKKEIGGQISRSDAQVERVSISKSLLDIIKTIPSNNNHVDANNSELSDFDKRQKEIETKTLERDYKLDTIRKYAALGVNLLSGSTLTIVGILGLFGVTPVTEIATNGALIGMGSALLGGSQLLINFGKYLKP